MEIYSGKDHKELDLLAHRIGMLNILLNTGLPGDFIRRVLNNLRSSIDEVLALDFDDRALVTADTTTKIEKTILDNTEIPDSLEGLA
jgi:hypothetical protein